MNGEKRKRATNFYRDECILLIDLVKPHEEVIESKRTDNQAIIRKDQLWQKITQSFNEKTTMNFRSLGELRKKYDNMKRTLRKKLLNESHVYGSEFAPWEHILLTMLNSGTVVKEEYEPHCEEEDHQRTEDNEYALINAVRNNSNIEVIDNEEYGSEDGCGQLSENSESITVSPKKHLNNLRRHKFRSISKSPNGGKRLMNAKIEQIRMENLYYQELIGEIQHKRKKRDLKMDLLRVELERSKVELKLLQRRLEAESEKANGKQ